MSLFRRFALMAIAGSMSLAPAFVPAAEPRTDSKTDAKAEAKQPISINLTPRVGRVQDVDGTVNAVGTPVIFIKSGLPGEPWWVQNNPMPSGPKQFKVKLIFGNEKSQPGAQFHVVAVMLPRTARLQDYRVGSQHTNLPEFPQSNRLQVTLLGGNQSPGVEIIPSPAAALEAANNIKPEGAADTDAAEMVGDDDTVSVVTPAADAEVRRVTEITGKVAAGHSPVILVRPLTNEKLWWIQNRPVIGADQSFKGKVVLGSEKTPEGTRFRVMVLAFDDAKAAAKLKVGESLKELPEGVKKSSEVTVTYRNSKPVGVEAKKAAPSPEPKTADAGKEKS